MRCRGDKLLDAGGDRAYAAVRVVAGGIPVGFQTPSSAFGKDFILTFPHTQREDLG